MADSVSYPQIPSTVWSGVWRILHDSPSRRIDEGVLAIELGVQKTAALQYLKELRRLGLFGDDGSTTDLGKKWRQDGDDPEIIQEILEYAYPQDLRELAPPGRLDRDKIVRWFVSHGLGAGSAKNKAATYIRVATGVSASETASTNGEVRSSRPSTPSHRKRSASSPNTNRATKKKEVEEASSDAERKGDHSQSGRANRPELGHVDKG